MIKYFSKIRKYLIIVFPVVIFFFIGKSIYTNFSEFQKYDYDLNFYYLTIAFFTYLIVLFVQLFSWGLITKSNNIYIGLSKTIISKVYSDFGKYIPGRIWGFAWLLDYYGKQKKSKKILGVCIIIEIYSWLLADLIVFFISTLLSDFFTNNNYKFLLIIIAILIIVLLIPKNIERISNYLLKLIKKDPISITIKIVQLIQIVFVNLLGWIIFSIALICFVNAFYPLGYNKFAFIIGAFALTNIISFVSIFTSAGLGIREGSLILFFKGVMPFNFATIISLTSRIWFVVCELIRFFIIFVYNKLYQYYHKY